MCVWLFLVHLFAHNAMSPSVSVTTFKDMDAIYAAHVDISNLENIPSSLATEADIQPGVVFLTRIRLADGINWGMAPTMLMAELNLMEDLSQKIGK